MSALYLWTTKTTRQNGDIITAVHYRTINTKLAGVIFDVSYTSPSIFPSSVDTNINDSSINTDISESSDVLTMNWELNAFNSSLVNTVTKSSL